MKIKLPILLTFLFAGALSAAQIHWYSNLGYFNSNSEAELMDESFRFELGVFRDNFVPTPANRDEWSTYWVPAQRVPYNAENGWYSGYFTVENNEAPFTKGAEAWVWGFSGDARGGEWILFRSSSWKWPQANPRKPTANQWKAQQANQTLIGQIANGNNGQLQSEAVENLIPPPTSFDQWAEENGYDPANADELLVSFATGGEGAPLEIRRASDQGMPLGVEIRLKHLADRKLNAAAIEVSTDLENWVPYARYARHKTTTATEMIFELDPESETEPKLFFRAKYER